MSIKEKIAVLKVDLAFAQNEVMLVQEKLNEAEGDIQNHIYGSLEKAENFLSNMFDDRAQEDCEGAGNCGMDEYVQDFIVDGKEYIATGTFEYNRHDRTYYYIDERSYRFEEKQ